MVIAKSVVVREFGSLGKFRVRLISTERGKQYLDIREFVEGANYSGYTRKGIMLTTRTQARLLREALDTIESEQLLSE